MLEYKQFLKETQNNIIQVTVLILGIVACIFAGLYVCFEYSYYLFNKYCTRIYQTVGTVPLLSIAKNQLSYVEKTVRLRPCYRRVTILSGDEGFYEDKAYYADGSLFEILNNIQYTVADVIKSIPPNSHLQLFTV